MAFVTVLVDRRARKHRLVGRAVRLMAARAGHFALPEGMRICLVDLGTLLDMAADTGVGLTGRDRHRVAPDVRIVTVGAADVLALVRAAFPEAVFLLGVTILADLV